MQTFLEMAFYFLYILRHNVLGCADFFFQLNCYLSTCFARSGIICRSIHFSKLNFFALKQHLPHQGDLHIFSMYTHTHKSHKTYYLSLKTHTHTHNTHTHIKTYFCFHIFSHVYIVSKLLSKGTILKK